MHINKTPYGLIISIIGPHLEETYPEALNLFTSKIPNVAVIGDGKTDIRVNNNDSSVTGLRLPDILSSISKAYSNLEQSSRILLYINVHGGINEGKHYVRIAQNEVLSSSYLFNMLKHFISQPMDIIFESCYSKLAWPDTSYLPTGSNILLPSENTIFLYNSLLNFDRMNNIVQFSITSFYHNYLAHLSITQNPILVTVGGETIDPENLSSKYLGKIISIEARDYVHKTFGYNICQDHHICHDKLSQLMDKMEVSQNISEFNPFNQEMELRFKEFDDVIEEQYNILMLKFYNVTDFCPKNLKLFKNSIDRHLFENKIPLEMNLSFDWDNFFKKDDDDDDDTLPPASLLYYGLIKEEMFLENSFFPKPEYPEFGKVYGIAIALDEFADSFVVQE